MIQLLSLTGTFTPVIKKKAGGEKDYLPVNISF